MKFHKNIKLITEKNTMKSNKSLLSIRKIINRWDPYDLIKESGAPEDEFQKEVEAIANNLTDNMSIDDIAKLVSEVFSTNFDDDFFSIDICFSVAKELHMLL